MKKIFYSVAVLMTIVFVACKSDSKEEKKEVPPTIAAPGTTTTPATNTTTLSQEPNPAAVAQPPVVVQPGNTTPVNIQAPATRTTVAAGMNPAHGEPGHRCDIPVGSPLNSPAAKTPAVTTTSTAPAPVQPNQQTVSVPQIVTTPPAAKVAAGMNPAHGEPGHRCDIAVGAPLNSPKSTPAVNVTPVTTPTPVKQN